MRILFVSIVGLVIAACTSYEVPRKAETLNANEVVFFVKDKTVDCVGVGPQQCLQVMRKLKGQNSPRSEWELFYDSIAGFTYEAGYEYELIVREIHIPLSQVPMDASSIRYELVREVRKILTYRP